jgi:hypothetical protein
MASWGLANVLTNSNPISPQGLFVQRTQNKALRIMVRAAMERQIIKTSAKL